MVSHPGTNQARPCLASEISIGLVQGGMAIDQMIYNLILDFPLSDLVFPISDGHSVLLLTQIKNFEAIFVSFHSFSHHIQQILLILPLKYTQNATTFNQLHHYHPGPKSCSSLAVMIAVASLFLPCRCNTRSYLIPAYCRFSHPVSSHC